MSAKFASGKHAIAECDRCGFRFKLKQLKALTIKTKMVNILVCPECWEEDQPQLQLGMYPVSDPQAIENPRPDLSYYEPGNDGAGGSRYIQWGWNPVGGSPAWTDTPNTLVAYGQLGTVEITNIPGPDCIVFARGVVGFTIMGVINISADCNLTMSSVTGTGEVGDVAAGEDVFAMPTGVEATGEVGNLVFDTPLVLVFDTTLHTKTVTIYLSGNVDVSVDWGDSSSETAVGDGIVTHTYAVDGVYTVTIEGTAEHFEVYSNIALTEVVSFGSLGLIDLSYTFYYCYNLTNIPSTLPSTVTSLNSTFYNCELLNDPNISAWDTSNVTDMSATFSSCLIFDQDLSGWNTSAVTTMESMFEYTPFNQDISGWDTSSVITMYNMFDNATAFNQDIGGWNTSSVIDMAFMFVGASAFNQDISGWDTSSVVYMQGLFFSATAFNQDISGWDVSSVEEMWYMFRNATNFNQNIGGWDTSSVTDMYYMFDSATSFDQDLSGWCVTLIPSAPTNFSNNTPAWNKTGRLPIWGTCP